VPDLVLTTVCRDFLHSTFSRHKLTIQHIIDTLCALSDRQQSLLVRVRRPFLPPFVCRRGAVRCGRAHFRFRFFCYRKATERLEVDDRTRGECFKALKNALKQEPLATHGLLFVGTKLLATYSKNKAPDIDPSDMLLLINDFRATFHPYGTFFIFVFCFVYFVFAVVRVDLA
jgi:hypothetical protein